MAVRWWWSVALLLAVPAGAALALTDLGSFSAALPPAAAPGLGFAGGVAPGWSFAQVDFVDPGYRDPDPALPSLHGYDPNFAAPPLAIGTLAEVAAVAPRARGIEESIASLDVARGGLDAAALGVFNIANVQNFTDNSFSFGGEGQRLTFRFAGQVGTDNDD